MNKIEGEYLTARECIAKFNDLLGVKLSEAAFAKHKKNGIFRTYQVEGSRRDYFKWFEVAEDYFENVGLGDEETEAAHKRFLVLKTVEERHQRIRQHRNMLKAYTTFDIADFDTGDMDDEERKEFYFDLRRSACNNSTLRTIDIVLKRSIAEMHPNYSGSMLEQLILNALDDFVETPDTVCIAWGVEYIGGQGAAD